MREVAAALQELKASRVRVEKDHTCDCSFSGQTESVCCACGDLSQQVKINLLWKKVIHKDIQDDFSSGLYFKIVQTSKCSPHTLHVITYDFIMHSIVTVNVTMKHQN